MITKILNIRDVEVFVKQLIAEGTNAHPDEDFENYVTYGTGVPTYNKQQVDVRNRLMQESFTVCAEAGIDIYNLMQEVYLVETGLGKYIPLPS